MKENRKVIIITGAAGFLGSAITVKLENSCRVIAVDNRIPSSLLRLKTPNVQWFHDDITHRKSVSGIFKKVLKKHGRIDFVLHLAFFWHFGTDYRLEYLKINDEGTRNIVDLCRKFHCKRLVFASTLSVLSQVAGNQKLNEKSKPESNLPYAQSKISSELMLVKTSTDLPFTILRIGAVFSEWCELPPLYILIKHWSRKSWMGRTIPGKGNTGFPYIHRDDVVDIVKKVIVRNDQLDTCEWFLACGSKTLVHTDLFPVIRKCLGHDDCHDSIHLPVWFVRLVLHFKCVAGKITGRMADERPWMMDHVDKPWIVDNSYTQEKLDWTCREGRDLLKCMPQMIDNFNKYQEAWIERMNRRNKRVYEYEG
ncbi:MAG: NAD(P)-dependent oxidoreductase [Candidatus Scalindua sp.]|nr:NAD(P)-dependent oxidoreductase [Candidatus Scalindua sp.]